jgi:hypothetical protein
LKTLAWNFGNWALRTAWAMHEPAGPVTPLTCALVTRPVAPATLTDTVATPLAPPFAHAETSPFTPFMALTT